MFGIGRGHSEAGEGGEWKGPCRQNGRACIPAVGFMWRFGSLGRTFASPSRVPSARQDMASKPFRAFRCALSRRAPGGPFCSARSPCPSRSRVWSCETQPARHTACTRPYWLAHLGWLSSSGVGSLTLPLRPESLHPPKSFPLRTNGSEVLAPPTLFRRWTCTRGPSVPCTGVSASAECCSRTVRPPGRSNRVCGPW